MPAAVRTAWRVRDTACYPHMPIGKVWIYGLPFDVCMYVCLFVRLWISQPRIKLAA